MSLRVEDSSKIEWKENWATPSHKNNPEDLELDKIINNREKIVHENFSKTVGRQKNYRITEEDTVEGQASCDVDRNQKSSRIMFKEGQVSMPRVNHVPKVRNLPQNSLKRKPKRPKINLK